MAYKKGDFPSAFQQFKELAELGLPKAQLNLAVLYTRGEGVAASNVYAHAWATLAGQNGEGRGTEIAAQLEPQLTHTSLRISSEIQSKYNQASLDARLLPRMLKDREYENHDPVRPEKPFIPAYPAEAEQRGIQGEVYVEFIVAPDGHPRIPRILYAVPRGVFETTVRDSVIRSVYLPARVNGQPVSTSVSTFYNFVVASVTIKDYGDLERRVQDIKLKAEAGDASAQMLYGTVIGVNSNSRVGSIELGGDVGNTQYDPGSQHIFVNVQTRGQLIEIDPATDQIVARIDLPERIATMAC